MEQIGRLTPHQVRCIYFRTDEDRERQKKPSLTYKEIFWKIERESRGRSEEETQARWDEYLRTNQA